ncbi:MAG: 16S rRNA (guanine(527)-N(7))-methyltransferase RsmG [Pseudomonadota bacterium]|nr:16S rRNA (guanine(527)-N(7))-methyltransferase RsmG [Pseudomonadota bacterium]
MDEEEARAWLQRQFDVPRETFERLEAFAAFLARENDRQNLVAKPTLDRIWSRHIADSAQLLRYAPSADARWVDLGTGAGFPGLIVAALHQGPVTLVEERRLRGEFLRRAAELLDVSPEILQVRAERMPPRRFDVISARAFAPLPRLLEIGTAFSTIKTLWLLPKGRSAQSELEALDSSWQGDFRLEPSLTDPDAQIIVAEGVKRKRR